MQAIRQSFSMVPFYSVNGWFLLKSLDKKFDYLKVWLSKPTPLRRRGIIKIFPKKIEKQTNKQIMSMVFAVLKFPVVGES